MQDAAQPKKPTLVPLIRYRDPKAAIAWLNKAFGFDTRCIASREDGSFAYAHLACGNTMIMVMPVSEDAAAPGKPPDKGSAPAEHGCYLVVEQLEDHLKRAKGAGAKIVRAIGAYEPGGSSYVCRDPQGQAWTFGTYDPWRDKALPVPAPRPRPKVVPRRLDGRRVGVAAAAALTVVALAVSVWRMQAPPETAAALAPRETSGTYAEVAAAPAPDKIATDQELAREREALAEEQAARQAADQELTRARAALAEEQAARQAADEELTRARKTLAEEQAARRAAEEDLTRARKTLAEAQAARQAAEASRRETLAELSNESAARQDAERAAKEREDELSAARATRDAAEQMVRDLNEWRTEAVRADGSRPRLEKSAAKAGTAAAGAAASAMPSKSDAAAGDARPNARSANPLIAEGQAAMAKGDIAAARRLFKRLAGQGSPEAALALGSTYDPVAIERVGLASEQADREQAKQWYRRAIELAQAAMERQPAP